MVERSDDGYINSSTFREAEITPADLGERDLLNQIQIAQHNIREGLMREHCGYFYVTNNLLKTLCVAEAQRRGLYAETKEAIAKGDKR